LYLSSVAITKAQDRFEGLMQRHSSSMVHVMQCCVTGFASTPTIYSVPCPKLRQLHLQNVEVQLGPADGRPGVLSGCAGLTELAMQGCAVHGVPAAAAFPAALPGLQSLTLAKNYVMGDICLLAELQKLTQLTHLSIKSYGVKQESLGQLSALVNLRHLTLQPLLIDDGPDVFPGGLPSQLARLTSLEICFPVQWPGAQCDITDQLQHLSSLTALQQLSVASHDLTLGDLSGLQYLSQLTGLQLGACSSSSVFSSSSISSWACQAGLLSLALRCCTVQPEALLHFSSLRTLSLWIVRPAENSSCEELLKAVSQLSLLTEVRFSPVIGVHPAAAAFTALTASTHLCHLQAHLWYLAAPRHYALFRPGSVHPHLRVVDLFCSEDSVCGSFPQNDAQL
jgi:hypothetical protein